MRESPACAQWQSPLRVDEECRNGAVRFLFCRNSGQPNDDVRFFHHGFEHGGRVVGFGE